MENLSREAILRMVGLHDAAHMVRQLNAIQLSLEEEQGKMVAYWTEIRKSEKEVTLLAGRVSANETNIGQLQVTATSLTASVSSLNTTVNGDGTQGSGLVSQVSSLSLTVGNINLSVQSLSTTVNGDGTQGSGLVSQVSSLSLTVGNINLSVQSLSTTVNGDGTQGSGLVSRVSSLELTESSISQRVGVIEGDYVKEAEISLMVKKDGNGYISNASIKADNIDFTFTRATNFISGGKTVMSINSSGDLWIAGEYRGGTITQNITIGTGTKKMVIEPTSTGARLVGRDGTTEVISVGFQNYGNVSPYVNINNGGSGSSYAYTQLDYNSIQFGSANNYMFAIKYNSSGRIAIHGNWSSWYKDTELRSINKGDVYVDGNGFLKVKDY